MVDNNLREINIKKKLKGVALIHYLLYNIYVKIRKREKQNYDLNKKIKSS